MDGVFEEIVINEDGTKIEVTIHGVKGSACSALQEKYLEHGKLVGSQLTGEYYERPAQTVQNTVNVRR